MTTKETLDKFKTVNSKHRNSTQALIPNENSQHYKRDVAKFYGESYKSSDRESDRGSIFQGNAANFYGLDQPAEGDKPFVIHKNDLEDPNKNKKMKSVLNQRRLKKHEMNMERNPTFSKNLRRFWGMKSQGKYSFLFAQNQMII